MEIDSAETKPETSNLNEKSDNMKRLLKMEFLSLLDKNSVNEFKSHYTKRNSFDAFKVRSKRNYKYIRILSVNNNKKLVVASMTNNVDLVEQLLIKKKVDPNVCDEFMRSPLHIAAGRGYENVVKLLIAHGGDVNKRDSLLSTPLHLAASICHMTVIKCLIDAGAYVNMKDCNNRTPLDLVTSKYKSHYSFTTNRFYDLFGVYTLLCSKGKHADQDDAMKNLFENLKIKENE